MARHVTFAATLTYLAGRKRILLRIPLKFFKAHPKYPLAAGAKHAEGWGSAHSGCRETLNGAGEGDRYSARACACAFSARACVRACVSCACACARLFPHTAPSQPCRPRAFPATHAH